MNVTLVNVLVLSAFVVGCGLVALMVVITQRSYKKDEQSPHWVVYPGSEGSGSHIGEPGRWAVVLDEAGPKPISVIKEIRGLTGLGLVAAKHLTDHTPSTVLSGIDHATATSTHSKLARAGARARMVEVEA